MRGRIAVAVVEAIADSACLVHRVFEGDDGTTLVPVGMAGAVAMGSETLAVESSLVAPLFAGRVEPVVFTGSAVPREEYAHVLVTRSIATLVYAPFFFADKLAGVIEVLAFSGAMGRADMESLGGLAGVAGPAILAAEEMNGSGRICWTRCIG